MWILPKQLHTTDADGGTDAERQIKQPLVRNINESASGLDDAIVYAADCQPCECCDDVICWKCGGHYADCPCPGPNSSDD